MIIEAAYKTSLLNSASIEFRNATIDRQIDKILFRIDDIRILSLSCLVANNV